MLSPGLHCKYRQYNVSSFRFLHLCQNDRTPEQHTHCDQSVPEICQREWGLHLTMQGGVEAAALGWVWRHPPGKMLRLWAPWRQVWITLTPAFRTSCFLFYLFMIYPVNRRISGSSLVVLFQHTHTHTHTHLLVFLFKQEGVQLQAGNHFSGENLRFVSWFPYLSAVHTSHSFICSVKSHWTSTTYHHSGHWGYKHE